MKKEWSYYHTCPDCGASLDPGEHCDCKKNQKALYLCDGHACEVCHNSDCHHTSDIRHAINFALEPPTGAYVEQKLIRRNHEN